METVTLKIEVEVHDWATHVAVDADGRIYEYGCEPKKSTRYQRWYIKSVLNGRCGVANWRETLTKVE
jgi:hypothetical protein